MAIQTSTDEYWEVDGTPLNTYAWAIETFGGSRFGLPPLRGTDVAQAYRPGQSFRPKVADSRIVSMNMWVVGADPESDTGAATAAVRQQFISNLRTLQKLFWTPRREIVLTRRWEDLGGMTVADAKAQISGLMEPTFTGRHRAVLSVDLKLADPFYYGTVATHTFSPGDTFTMANPGDDTSPTNLQITLTGPLTNPSLSNAATTPPVVVSYTGAIGSGETVVLDVAAPRAVSSVGPTLVNSKITASGSLWWMEMFPGNNAITFDADAGSGTCEISYRPAYV